MIKEDVRMKKWAPRVLLAAALAGLSAFLLKGDVWTFWTWWLLAFLMGMVAMPVTGRLFAGFEDKGWMFSKVLAITVTGFLTWFLVTAKILPFTAATCIGVSIVCAVGCGVLYHFQGKNGIDCFPSGKVNLIYGEEILFFIFFLIFPDPRQAFLRKSADTKITHLIRRRDQNHAVLFFDAQIHVFDAFFCHGDHNAI